MVLLEQLPEAYQAQRQIGELKEMITAANRLDQRSDPYISELSLLNMNFDRVPLLD